MFVLLPVELIFSIFQYLQFKQIIEIRRVCYLFKSVIDENPLLFKQIIFQEKYSIAITCCAMERFIITRIIDFSNSECFTDEALDVLNFFGIPNLQEFYLSGCNLINPEFSFPKLEILDIANNKINSIKKLSCPLLHSVKADTYCGLLQQFKPKNYEYDEFLISLLKCDCFEPFYCNTFYYTPLFGFKNEITTFKPISITFIPRQARIKNLYCGLEFDAVSPKTMVKQIEKYKKSIYENYGLPKDKRFNFPRGKNKFRKEKKNL